MASFIKDQMAEEIHELRQSLKTYRPGKKSKGVYGRKEVQFPEHLCIGLFGRTGCGKTSLICSLKFAICGSFSPTRRRDIYETPGGHKVKRILAHLIDNISVVDNCGLDELTQEETLKELKAQIDGRRGYNEEIQWKNEVDDHIVDAYKRKDSISCAVFVFSALDNFSQSTNGLYQVVRFLEAQQGRCPVAVITNVDFPDRQRIDKLRSTLKVKGISKIFEVANICSDNTTIEIVYLHSLLSLLDRCMTDGDQAAVFKHHQHKEQMATRAAGLLPSNNDFDDNLVEVAKRVRKNTQIDTLGKKLGFSPDDIHGYIATNYKTQNVTYYGTLQMLRDWRKGQTNSTERGALKTALENSGEIRLADDLFPSSQ